jgi:hypothetical protein
MAIHLYGTDGVLVYDLTADRIRGANRKKGKAAANLGELSDIPIPSEKAGSWRVEAEFADAIRQGTPIRFTDCATGLQYMEFTEAVARSAEEGSVVELPLA